MPQTKPFSYETLNNFTLHWRQNLNSSRSKRTFLIWIWPSFNSTLLEPTLQHPASPKNRPAPGPRYLPIFFHDSLCPQMFFLMFKISDSMPSLQRGFSWLPQINPPIFSIKTPCLFFSDYWSQSVVIYIIYSLPFYSVSFPLEYKLQDGRNLMCVYRFLALCLIKRFTLCIFVEWINEYFLITFL